MSFDWQAFFFPALDPLRLLLWCVLGSALVLGRVLLGRPIARRAERGRLVLLDRFLPLVSLLALIAFMLLALADLTGVRSLYFVVAVVGFSGVLLYASRSLATDLLTGLVLRAEGALRTGDVLTVGDTRGRIKNAGPRSVLLALDGGGEKRLPYAFLAQITSAAGARRPAPGGVSFVLTISDPAAGPDSLRRDLREFLLLHPFVAPDSEPRIKFAPGPGTPPGDFSVDVTVACSSTDFAGDIEVDVRRFFEEHDAATGKPG